MTHRLIHPVRRTKASKRTRQSPVGDSYVVGYREDGWDPDNPGPSVPFVPLAALMFLPGDVIDGHRQQDDPASIPLLAPHTRGGIDPPASVGRTRRARVSQGVGGGVWAQRVGNRPGAAIRPRPGC